MGTDQWPDEYIVADFDLTTRIEVLLSGNLPLSREEAIAKGLNHDRIVLELVMKMSRLQVTSQSKFIVQLLVDKVDKMELTCLKALILFNDDNDARLSETSLKDLLHPWN